MLICSYTIRVNVQVLITIVIISYTARGLVTFSNCSDGDIRLIGGMSEYEGRLEICINNVWGTVCLHTYNRAAGNTQVVCHQLGHQELGKL